VSKQIDLHHTECPRTKQIDLYHTQYPRTKQIQSVPGLSR